MGTVVGKTTPVQKWAHRQLAEELVMAEWSEGRWKAPTRSTMPVDSEVLGSYEDVFDELARKAGYAVKRLPQRKEATKILVTGFIHGEPTLKERSWRTFKAKLASAPDSMEGWSKIGVTNTGTELWFNPKVSRKKVYFRSQGRWWKARIHE